MRTQTDSAPDGASGARGERHKDFGSFKICRSGSEPNTFLLRGQIARVRPFDSRCSGRLLLPGREGASDPFSLAGIEVSRFSNQRHGVRQDLTTRCPAIPDGA